jgi:DHA1 family bicyclomycin/chloramphenicol resistance-like MFS transporter
VEGGVFGRSAGPDEGVFAGEALARALALTMIAGAAAPGFSPLLGSAFDGLFGWRVTFLVVAAFGVVVALHYAMRIGETHPADRSDRDGKLASDGASRSDRRGSSPPQVARGL